MKCPTIRKCFLFAVTLLVIIFLSILLASAVLEFFDMCIQGVRDIKTLHQIEKVEREKLKIQKDVKIIFVLDNNWGILDRYRMAGAFGLTNLGDETNKNFTIYLRKPATVFTVRHEIYHVYRFSDPNPERFKHKIREQFLAHTYGIWGVNLEFLFKD